ncbi:sodium:solute symporter family protein [Botrimarina mediterranea]|uniref:Sodium/glucose cotransporter n=1 Tax=Botrimarina mediterranea TaxID=2528022 RepID=A0A518KAA2_9BACT|nr:sodium:solute symporter family protein [Botrimarina mediterranea]QDV74711.1 Sodium/glucose cotransporter [Botrimarina mediterranea]
MPILAETAASIVPALTTLDVAIIAASLLGVLAVGALTGRQSGKDASQFFLSGRGMPWWLLGMSMVATTFAADTPNLVTDLVRTGGVAGNWVWWAFLLTGMLTVFNYAGLWRRSGLMTDLGFYEMRYSGRPAAFLRGFRALYLGVVFNVMVMSVVMLAAIKIGQVLLGVGPLVSIVSASVITVVFSAVGGFRAVVLTDAVLFVLAMTGSIAAACYAVNRPEVGGLAALVSSDAVAGKLAFLPPLDFGSAESINTLLSVLLIPLAVQWWSVWYPGSEPGGGGYLAQRMLAAKDPGHATAAALFFNCAHYALRPWPWILVALASLVVYPDLNSIREAFPGIDPSKIGHDLAYPAMLTQMPSGWLGIVLASLLAAYMSTISTHLNWGSSYVVNDFYQRFVEPDASDARLVVVGRVSTVLMMIAAAAMALQLQTASQGFQILLQIGAGTGLLFILRWYWWRINAYSEVAAMVVSFVVALVLAWYGESLGVPDWAKLTLGVAVTTAGWLMVAILTPSDDAETLEEFCRSVNPAGPGWGPVRERATAAGRPIPAPLADDNVWLGLARMVLGCVAVYAMLFATGYALYGELVSAAITLALSTAAASGIVWTYRSRFLKPTTPTIESLPHDPSNAPPNGTGDPRRPHMLGAPGVNDAALSDAGRRARDETRV